MSTPDEVDTTTVETALLVAVASSLQRAAILLRDIHSAMPLAQQVKIPADIYRRMGAVHYQGCFDELPDHIRAAAEEVTLADPDIIEARRLDAEANT